MNKLDRLNKQNVRSSDPRKPLQDLSLEKLRQVSGGCAYAHPGPVIWK